MKPGLCKIRLTAGMGNKRTSAYGTSDTIQLANLL